MGVKLPYGNLKLQGLGFLLKQNNVIRVCAGVTLVCLL
jgi:hypothetical protein